MDQRGTVGCLTVHLSARRTTDRARSPSLRFTKSATRKDTMKAVTTSSYLRLTAILAVAAPIAAVLGTGNWH